MVNLADIPDVKPKLITNGQDKILDSSGSQQSMKVPVEEKEEIADDLDVQEEAKVEQWPPSPRSPTIQERPPSQNFVGLIEEEKGDNPNASDRADSEGQNHR